MRLQVPRLPRSPSVCPQSRLSPFSSLGDGGTRSPCGVKPVDWLGFTARPSAPGTRWRAGSVEQRLLALLRGSCGGGPLRVNSSRGSHSGGALGDSGRAGGGWAGCWERGVRGGEKGSAGGRDTPGHSGTRGMWEDICCSLVRLEEWLGRGKLYEAGAPRGREGRVEHRATPLERAS